MCRFIPRQDGREPSSGRGRHGRQGRYPGAGWWALRMKPRFQFIPRGQTLAPWPFPGSRRPLGWVTPTARAALTCSVRTASCPVPLSGKPRPLLLSCGRAAGAGPTSRHCRTRAAETGRLSPLGHPGAWLSPSPGSLLSVPAASSLVLGVFLNPYPTSHGQDCIIFLKHSIFNINLGRFSFRPVAQVGQVCPAPVCSPVYLSSFTFSQPVLRCLPRLLWPPAHSKAGQASCWFHRERDPPSRRG